MSNEYFVKDIFKIVNWFRVKNFSDMKQDEMVEPLSQMKVMKLLYYVQGVSLAAYGKAMFPDDILAWKYGPVVEKVYYKYHGQRSIVNDLQDGMDSQSLDDYSELTSMEDVNIVLTSVEETYGNMSAIELMEQTHNETPWKNTPQSSVIAQGLIEEFFKKEVLSGKEF